LTPARIYPEIEALSSVLEERLIGRAHVFVLCDENTLRDCFPILSAACPSLNSAHMLEIDPGEDNKCLEIAGQLWSCLAETKADRNTLLINLGGGVVTDMGGFVASSYKRGIGYINIPTSLMAQTDAGIGGKTAINHEGVKNIIGSFYPPSEVLIYPGFLETLDEEELLSGMAEMLKHGLISYPPLWRELSLMKPTEIQDRPDLIEKSCRIKEKIVSLDPEECNVRKLLNAGHSIGHALESLALQQNRSLTHGRAVAQGLAIETEIAFQKGLLPQNDRNEVVSVLKEIFNPLFKEIPPFDEFLPFLENDKKNHGSTFRFSLLTAIGSAGFDIAVSREEIASGLQASNFN